MQRLQYLVQLKRAADTIDGAEAYFRGLYAAAADWTENGGTRLDIAALVYDGLLDRLAHDTDGTEQPSERSHTAERADAALRDLHISDMPANGRTA